MFSSFLAYLRGGFMHEWAWAHLTAQQNDVFFKDLSSECDQILRKWRLWSHLLKNSLMKDLLFVQGLQRMRYDVIAPGTME